MRLTDLEKAVQSWEMQQIRNLMGRYEYYHTAKMHKETVRLFALERDDIFIDNVSLGVYKGPQGIKRFFKDFHEVLDGDRKGSLCIHTLTTEVIEVAKDGQTAKGLWFSPGLETREENGKLEAYWVWGKYAVDFIKVDGEWKFWHFYITDNIQCDYHHSWIESRESKENILSDPRIPKPDGPSRYTLTTYSLNHIEQLIPPIPEPYDTFEE